MSAVNWLWGGDTSEPAVPTTIVARDSWLGSTHFERITQAQANTERAQRWWKLWNWGYVPDPEPDLEADRKADR